MKAYASVSGGVIFVPDKLSRKKKKTVSYRDLVETKIDAIKAPVFGKRKTTKADNQAAA
ncbi:MAG: hypothetical protein KTR28_01650 [Micavibrio sp.]|nr:hypothetical protein [Micavibrio sp.]